jgi:hypothetical protein
MRRANDRNSRYRRIRRIGSITAGRDIRQNVLAGVLGALAV